LKLPHLPDPTEGVRDAVSGAAHAGARVTKRVLKHLDEVEGRRNRHMHAQFAREGKKEEDGSWRTRGGKVWDPDLGRERNRAPAPTKPHYHAPKKKG